MIDCPETLHSGADLIVSLGVYLCPSAFKPLNVPSQTEEKFDMYIEGKESIEEEALRERKASLLRLFDAVGLRPRRGNKVHLKAEKSKQSMHSDAMDKLSQRPAPSKSGKKEIVGDGEEVELEGEELGENDLDVIYRR
jgi:DNA repair protein RAD5